MTSPFWQDVKRLEADPRFAVLRKRKPGYMRAAQRYEHGADVARYRRWEAEGVRAVVVVEQRPPNGEPGPVCLWMKLSTCALLGRHLRKWPNASGGESGLGGWLWSRSAMKAARPREVPALLEAPVLARPRAPRLPAQRSLF